jgi:hypothetical protein
MKKTNKKSLNLAAETLRKLDDDTLARVGGAMMNNSFSHCWASGCCPATEAVGCR